MAKIKGLSWFVSDRLGFRNSQLKSNEQRQAPRGLDTVLRTLRRRLDDRVADVFNAACVSGDLDVAAKLLAILEDMHDRRRLHHGNERREISDELIVRCRRELQRVRESDAKAKADKAD
jgi:uncharacterized protein (DUF2267 family)